MGQEETEERLDQPENELEIVKQGPQVECLLDLSLGSSDTVPIEIDAEANPLAMCQICMDFYGSTEVVRNVCGPECLAEICNECLVQHLTAMVYSFYPGVLPKMRCPVCLVVLNKAQWQKFVLPPSFEATEESLVQTDETPIDEENGESDYDDGTEQTDVEAPETTQSEDAWEMDHSHVLEKFEMLCRQSCGFQSPCCHDTNYSMLSRSRENEAHGAVAITLPTTEATKVNEFTRLYREYCFHRIEVDELYGFIYDSFREKADAILDAAIANTFDDERRANLLLFHLFRKPNTYTRCCEHPVCFKCKAAHHHEGLCRDFLIDESLLDCPGCRVTLVKVDGCDTVTCVCGQSIEWPQEVKKQGKQRKKLVPIDSREYSLWSRWHRHMRDTHSKIVVGDTLRKMRLQRMLRDHRPQLQKLVDQAVRRARLNIFVRQQGDQLRRLVRARINRRKAETLQENGARSSLIAPAA